MLKRIYERQLMFTKILYVVRVKNCSQLWIFESFVVL